MLQNIACDFNSNKLMFISWLKLYLVNSRVCTKLYSLEIAISHTEEKWLKEKQKEKLLRKQQKEQLLKE